MDLPADRSLQGRIEVPVMKMDAGICCLSKDWLAVFLSWEHRSQWHWLISQIQEANRSALGDTKERDESVLRSLERSRLCKNPDYTPANCGGF